MELVSRAVDDLEKMRLAKELSLGISIWHFDAHHKFGDKYHTVQSLVTFSDLIECLSQKCEFAHYGKALTELDAVLFHRSNPVAACSQSI